MPTGTGKTETVLSTIESAMMADPAMEVLGLAHRQELVYQPWERWQKKNGDVPNMEMGDIRKSNLMGSHRLTFASKDSLHPERLKIAFPDPKRVGLIWADEAHRLVRKSPSWWHIINYFMDGNPDCKLIGTTATPDRADEESLGSAFESVAFDYPLFSTDGSASAIGDGWLVPIKQEYVLLGDVSFERIGCRGGDFIDSQLEKALLEDKCLYKITEATREIAEGRPTLCFTSGIEQAIRQAMIFNASSCGSSMACASSVPLHLRAPFVVMSGDTDSRKQMLKDWNQGKFQIMNNAMVFTEGFDFPGIGVVSMGRPTKSRALFTQMVGRGTRILPGIIEGQNRNGTFWRLDSVEERRAAIESSTKPFMTVLDFVGCSNLPLMSSVEVLGGKESDEVVTRARSYVRDKRMDVAEAIVQAKSDIEDELEERKRVRAKVGSIQRLSPMEVLGVIPPHEPGWHKGRKATPGQSSALTKFKVEPDVISRLSFCEASAMMDRLVKRSRDNLCSYKQAKLLAKYGESPNLTFPEASFVIDKIAGNSWQAFPEPISKSVINRREAVHA